MLRRWLRRLAADEDTLTTSAGRERYARSYDGASPLGDEWNLPDVLGMNLAPEEIVAYVDRRLIAADAVFLRPSLPGPPHPRRHRWARVAS